MRMSESIGSRSAKTRLMLAAIVLIAVMLAILAMLGRGDGRPDGYVALGDSFSAGMGISPRTADTVPAACLQSSLSYPYLVQEERSYGSFASVACSGAVMADLYDPQELSDGQANRPQLDRLHGDESLVTLSIGGNDVGFWGVVLDCFSNDDPRATPCRDKYLAGGRDRLAERVAKARPFLERAIGDVIDRSPQALVYLVGYTRIVPADGAGCRKPMRASAADAAYFDDFQNGLNDMMRAAANARGVRFIDIYAQSAGHDACGPPSRRWVEPRVGSRLYPDVQVHPNAAGERAVARLVLDALVQDRP